MSFNILCIDDDPKFLLATKVVLKRKHKVFTAPTFSNGLELLDSKEIDMLFLDVHLGEENAINSIEKVKSQYPHVDIVMLSGERDTGLIVKAINKGAIDYVCKPCPAEELLAVVEKNLKTRNVKERYSALIEDMNADKARNFFIGKSEALTTVLESAKRLKGYNASVLIEGESGTGKELIARYLHGLELDPGRPFIAVNCAAIPENLLESELFGYEQGAFTGASKRKIGKFELANDGDIFLDEINSLKPELQAKLLRVLQEKEFYRLGGTESIQVRFRVISATNINLQDNATREGFRQDLLYRLRVISLIMPPLRERKEDIPSLVDYFVKKHRRPGVAKKISQEVISFFRRYDWPGNIRELENVIQSLLIMSLGEEVTNVDLPKWLKGDCGSLLDPKTYENAPKLKADSIDQSLKDFLLKVEQTYIKNVIESTGGNITEAARVLKISRSKVYYTLKGSEE